MSEKITELEQPQELRAKTLWEGGLRTNTLIRGFEVQSDDPKEEWGTNTAPAPAEIFVGSIGACFVTTFAWHCWSSRLSISSISAALKSKLEKIDGKEKLTEIEMKLKVTTKTDAPDKLERCYQLSTEKCSVLNTIDCEKKIEFEYKIDKE